MTTLDAMLSDPDPAARLLAADWLEEHQPERELEALCLRVGGMMPQTDPDGMDTAPAQPYLKGYWRVWTHLSPPLLFVYAQRVFADCQGPTYCRCVAGPAPYGWSKFDEDGVLRDCTPPPTLEAAAVSVLRRRLALGVLSKPVT